MGATSSQPSNKGETHMKNIELELIKSLLDDYADIVFNDIHDYNRKTPIDLVKALKIVKREIENEKQ